MADQPARRASFQIVFGEGTERWSFPDPWHPLVEQAQHRVRYGAPHGRDVAPTNGDALVLADTVSALYYLIHTCPSTKLACEKLAKVRAAVRKLGSPDETVPPPNDETD